MHDIDIHRRHDLGIERARKLAERMAEDLGRKFGLSGGWDGDELRFERPGVKGLLSVTATDLRLSVTLGLLLKAMKGSIERAVHEEIDTLFAREREEPAAARRAGAAATRKKAPGRPKKGG